MARSSFLISIDVGSTKICTILAEAVDGNIARIWGMSDVPSRGVQRGVINDLDDTGMVIKESLDEVERNSKRKVIAYPAYANIGNKYIDSLNRRAATSITRRGYVVKQDDLDKTHISAGQLPLPNDRVKLDAIPRRFFLDGQAGIKNPVGMVGTELEEEAHIITVGAYQVENLQKCLRGVGIKKIGKIVASALASSEAVLEPEEKEEGVILADIGGGTTDIAVFREGTIWYTHTLPVGGNQVSKDLSMGLDIPANVAGELKEKHGNVDPEEEAKVGNFAFEGYRIPYQDLYYIIKARIEEILRMIMLELPHHERAIEEPRSVVLTGGTANLPGIEVLARDVFNLPVRVGGPRGVAELNEILDNPAYATSVGLLLSGTK